MHDGPKILIGVVVFLALISFPIWYNAAMGTTASAPVLEKAVKGDQCVQDSTWMIANHMDLLNEWRDDVVRRGDRFVDVNGVQMEKSLSNTCLNCHENKDKFCDQCHDYMGVAPYCWECHVIPKEVSDGNR